jgi:hypothetical protein
MVRSNEAPTFSSIDTEDSVLFSGGDDKDPGEGNSGNFLQDEASIAVASDKTSDGELLSDAERQAFKNIVAHFGKVALDGGEGEE